MKQTISVLGNEVFLEHHLHRIGDAVKRARQTDANGTSGNAQCRVDARCAHQATQQRSRATRHQISGGSLQCTRSKPLLKDGVHDEHHHVQNHPRVKVGAGEVLPNQLLSGVHRASSVDSPGQDGEAEPSNEDEQVQAHAHPVDRRCGGLQCPAERHER